MTRDEMGKILKMTAAEYAAWLKRGQNEVCRGLGIPLMWPEGGGRAAAAPAKVFRTTTPPRPKATPAPKAAPTAKPRPAPLVAAWSREELRARHHAAAVENVAALTRRER